MFTESSSDENITRIPSKCLPSQTTRAHSDSESSDELNNSAGKYVFTHEIIFPDCPGT